MGLGNFRVRLLVAFVVVLLFWQSMRYWFHSNNDPAFFIKVKEDVKNGEIQPSFQKVFVGVYYEALCPDSRSFIITQVEPTFQALGERIVVQMVPYGKATTTKTDSGYKFTCQHGPAECDANMIHACAIDIIKDPLIQLEFLVCMIRNNIYPQNIMKTCAEKMHLDYKPILDCHAQSRGKELLAMYGEMTDSLRPRVSFIPTITLDKSTGNQREILKNLLKEVCRLYKDPPKNCDK